MVTLARPPTKSSLKITNRSFQYAAPYLWNELPTELRETRQILSPSRSPPITHDRSSSPSSLSPLSSSLTRSFFHSGKSFPPQTFSSPTGLILQTLCPFNVFILLNGWICLHRLSRLSVGFRTHSKSLQFNSFTQQFYIVFDMQ